MQPLHPPGWVRPKGYAHGALARGTLVVTGGLLGWDGQERFVADDFLGQLRQVLVNLKAVLAEAGAGPEHLVRLTWYLADRREYLADLTAVGEIYRAELGRHYPPMTVIEVAALMEPGARLEVEAMAVIPDGSPGGGAAASG
ncbi:RidA family protein [Roseospirillum parvum]|uniref:Enamine deaminase RidA, house cleaning of reactive enamine intermediates, YjgF/YER057c/UK114 family n=1 Tax=Roseospirillum parvum TaxID=83401 RepID=A0A1G7WVK8_9PROT|nr:RidA family protein [Roseospirillum parvum]SDG75300.1 Enamine deaminase RidA, house cleaning of reactive enamine intermediates, YjgF/YER057c/UK114 family [Roseospirillum parvum]